MALLWKTYVLVFKKHNLWWLLLGFSLWFLCWLNRLQYTPYTSSGNQMPPPHSRYVGYEMWVDVSHLLPVSCMPSLILDVAGFGGPWFLVLVGHYDQKSSDHGLQCRFQQPYSFCKGYTEALWLKNEQKPLVGCQGIAICSLEQQQQGSILVFVDFAKFLWQQGLSVTLVFCMLRSTWREVFVSESLSRRLK